MKLKALIFISTIGLLFSNCTKTESIRLTDYVNPMIGTSGHGHTFPGATVPFGMVQLVPTHTMKAGTGVPVIITPTEV